MSHARSSLIVGWSAALLLIAAGFVSGSSGAVLAAQSGLTAEQARQKLDARQRELEATRKRAKEVTADLKAIERARADLIARRIDAARRIQGSEKRLGEIEARLGTLQGLERKLRGKLAKQRGTISKLLAVMQRMGRNPPPVMITQRSDALKMVRSAMMLAAAFPELKKEALALGGRLTKLVAVIDGVRTERQRLRVETTRLSEARTQLASLLANKQKTMAVRRSELKKIRIAAAQISRNVRDLDQLIEQLDRTIAGAAGLGAYERDLARKKRQAAGQGPAQPAPGGAASAGGKVRIAALPKLARPQIPGAGPGGGQVNPKSPPAVEIAPRRKLALFNPGRMVPAIPFSRAKGSLALPAQGRRVLSFGDRTQYGGESKGIVIETRGGAQITSPCDGWIVYAGTFRSYGQILIINAGEGYHVLLAGMSQINVSMSQFVLAGEPVGTMASVVRVRQSQRQAPVLYVEFRKEKRPINPAPWWADGSK